MKQSSFHYSCTLLPTKHVFILAALSLRKRKSVMVDLKDDYAGNGLFIYG